MSATIRIVIVDDHKLFTAGLAAILKLIGKDVEIEEFSSGRQALSRLENEPLPDLLLVDLDMPALSGLDLLRAIASRNMNLTAAVVSASTNPQAIQLALDIGARGYIPKSLPPQLMLQGVNTLLSGKDYIPEQLESIVQTTFTSSGRARSAQTNQEVGADKLSSRQLDILGFMGRGLTNKEIANLLGISVSTVKFHASSLFKILEVKNRTQCIHVALERNLITSQ